MNKNQLQQIIKEEISSYLKEGFFDSVGLKDTKVEEDEYKKFTDFLDRKRSGEVTKSGIKGMTKHQQTGKVEWQYVGSKWEEVIGHKLTKPEEKNLLNRLRKDGRITHDPYEI